jgi:hypothetical protein
MKEFLLQMLAEERAKGDQAQIEAILEQLRLHGVEEEF